VCGTKRRRFSGSPAWFFLRYVEPLLVSHAWTKVQIKSLIARPRSTRLSCRARNGSVFAPFALLHTRKKKNVIKIEKWIDDYPLRSESPAWIAFIIYDLYDTIRYCAPHNKRNREQRIRILSESVYSTIHDRLKFLFSVFPQTLLSDEHSGLYGDRRLAIMFRSWRLVLSK